ncbi:MAG: hypothetical protein IH611_02405 [Deltaproteobacteria bacterium]|nr:hypothetical protein [Deltaproteobacteria bacterium]
MKPHGSRILPIALSILLFAAVANAAAILPVNGAGSGIFTFDQPSVVTYGTAAHVAFVGDAEGDNTFKLYYAAVNGAAEFQSAAATQASILLTPAVAIDNGAGYDNALHPQIAVWDANRLVVVFQGVPTGAGSGNYKLFRAIINIRNNVVTSHTVNEIVDSGSGRLGGVLVDPAFQLSTSDNTLRIAYADASTEYSNVYFARVSIDNAAVAGAPILLSSGSSQGVKPLPRLKLDSDSYSHVVWAANNNASTPTGIYYSLVRRNSSGIADNLAIGATQVVYGSYRWGFPSVIAESPSSVYVFAADQPYGQPGIKGALAFSRLNPSAVTHDGQPVNVANLTVLTNFFLYQPGGSVATGTFDTYQPDVFRDIQGYFHVAGYGYRSAAYPYQGTPGKYYAISLDEVLDSYAVTTVPDLALYPLQVGTGDRSFGMQIPGDYTRAAFASFNLKGLHFWSGPDDVTEGASNLYVTSTADADISSGDDSGCMMAKDPRRGETGRIPGALLLLLPALLLLFLKEARRALARR